MNISSLQIPKSLISLLESHGYSDLYPPQEQSINNGLLDGNNLLLTTPTASGKTLVAIIAAGMHVLNGGKVVYLTPLRALADEKYREFKMLEALHKPDGDRPKVLISTGDYDSSGELLGRGDIMILTNEKFDSMIRHGVSWLDDVRLFVADEIHLLGEGRRGPTIEMILAKILHLADDAQILGLSATVSNRNEMAKWLGAKLVNNEWRPVKLVEGIHYYGEVVFTDGRKRTIDQSGRGAIIDVAVDMLKDGGQSLIFAETRRRAVSLATKAAEVVEPILPNEEVPHLKSLADKILGEGDETELGRKLALLVSRGVAFHHAGLIGTQRRIIEDGFRTRKIKILASTPTLAAGVNLPARRVVISSLMRYNADVGGRTAISVLDYKQMCGRAGRPKYDPFGETILLASSDLEKDAIYDAYITAEPEPIKSQLANLGPLRSHILASIASIPGINIEDLTALFNRTLLAIQHNKKTIQLRINDALEYLMIEGLIDRRGERFVTTEFGKRVSMLYIDPDTGVLFRRVIHGAKKGISHDTGIIHSITSSRDFSPQFSLRNSDWDKTMNFIENHKSEFLEPIPVGEYDLYESFFEGMRMVPVLYAWMDEWNADRILGEYGIEPGDLHRAVESATWLAYSFYELARILERSDLLPEVSVLRSRIHSGVRTELLPLIRLEMIGRVRARELFQAGFTDLRKISQTPTERLASVPKIGTAVASRIKEQLSRS